MKSRLTSPSTLLAIVDILFYALLLAFAFAALTWLMR